MKTKLSPVKISIIISILVALWVFSGVFANEDMQQEEKNSTYPVVKTEILTAKKRFNNIVLRGKTQPSREVELRIEVSGKVQEIIANDGAVMKAGEPILRMDSRGRYENLRRAQAEVEEKRTYYQAAKRLFEKELQSEVGLSKANSEFELAKSNLKEAQLEVDNITLKAPFDGQVQKIEVEIGDYLQVGDLVATYIDSDPFEVMVSIPELQISQIHLGKEISVSLANGAEFQGHVSYIAAIANAGTRTYDVELTIENSESDFFDGMTAEVKIPLDEVMAQQISPAYFSLSTDGKIGVKIVDANKKAKFVEVQILEDDENGMWISGLPERVEIITTGHEYVLDGQQVEIGK